MLVRVYGRKTELLVDRETELRNFQVLRAHGCAPDLYCAFQNGLCYQFLPGIALGPSHVRDPHIFRCAAPPHPRVCRAGGEMQDGDTSGGFAVCFQLSPLLALLQSRADVQHPAGDGGRMIQTAARFVTVLLKHQLLVTRDCVRAMSVT